MTTRRGRAVLWGTLVVCLALGKAAHAGAPSLYVYLHTALTPRALETRLEGQLPGVEVTVFGRYRDLARSVQRTPPDAVLALAPVAEALKLPVIRQGIRNKQTTEPLIFVSLQALPPSPTLDGKVIGVLDWLGRKGMRTFVAELLQRPPQDIRVSRVTKVEDLVPLLTLGIANVLMVPASLETSLRQQTTTFLEVAPVPKARMGLPVLASNNPTMADPIAAALAKLDAALHQPLGVDRWR